MFDDWEEGDEVCLLPKSLYGLHQAGRKWYEKLSAVFTEFGLKPSNVAPWVYYQRKRANIVWVGKLDQVAATSWGIFWQASVGWSCFLIVSSLAHPRMPAFSHHGELDAGKLTVEVILEVIERVQTMSPNHLSVIHVPELSCWFVFRGLSSKCSMRRLAITGSNYRRRPSNSSKDKTNSLFW